MSVEDIPKGDRAVNPLGRTIYFSALALLGLVLLILPGKGLVVGAFLLGVWLLLDGISGLINFFQSNLGLKELQGKVLFIRSLVWILLGVLFLFRPGFMSRMGVGLAFFLVGLFFLVQAILIWMVTSEEPPLGILLLGVIGILLMISPLFSAYWFIRLLGLLILGRAGMGIFQLWSHKI